MSLTEKFYLRYLSAYSAQHVDGFLNFTLQLIPATKIYYKIQSLYKSFMAGSSAWLMQHQYLFAEYLLNPALPGSAPEPHNNPCYDNQRRETGYVGGLYGCL